MKGKRLVCASRAGKSEYTRPCKESVWLLELESPGDGDGLGGSGKEFGALLVQEEGCNAVESEWAL